MYGTWKVQKSDLRRPVVSLHHHSHVILSTNLGIQLEAPPTQVPSCSLTHRSEPISHCDGTSSQGCVQQTVMGEPLACLISLTPSICITLFSFFTWGW